MSKPLTLEDKINREYWDQQQEISRVHSELWESSPVETHAVIWQAYHSRKALSTWVAKPTDDPDQIVAFYTERYTPSTHLIGWGSTADYNPLIWKQYGTNCGGTVPEWYHDAIWKAELCAILAKPADVRYKVEHISGSHYVYTIWDQANPFYHPWRVNLQSSSPANAESYVRREYDKHKHLHEGGVNCLIHFHQTGQAIVPCWMPDNGLVIRNRDGKIIGHYPRLSK